MAERKPIECEIVHVIGHGPNMEEAVQDAIIKVKAAGRKFWGIKVLGFTGKFKPVEDDLPYSGAMVFDYSANCEVAVD